MEVLKNELARKWGIVLCIWEVLITKYKQAVAGCVKFCKIL